MSSGAVLQFNVEVRQELVAQANKNRTASEAFLRSLAAEIAMGINDFDKILANHGMGEEEWNRLRGHPKFLQFLSEANILWGSTANAKNRIQAKMEAMVEAALPAMWQQLMKGDELTPSKVKFVEAMMRGGGVGVSEGSRGQDGVSITINMDSTPVKPTVTINHQDDM